MTNHVFDKDYVGDAPSTVAPAPKSEMKSFLKQPVDQNELKRYGSSKPRRVVIRARLIDGKG